jgi:hypothetical protein
MSGSAGLRGQRVYGQHGTRHSPRGTDPSQTDVWQPVSGSPATAWSSGHAYSQDDIVSHGDFNWAAIRASTDIEPEVDAGWVTYWTVSASLFVNGSNASPTTPVPNPVPMRYRLSVGPPNIVDPNGTIDVYTHHQIEIQGDVTGLVIGDTVFVIPRELRHDYDVPYHTHDIYGAYVPCRLLSSGEFIWGQV